MSFVQFLSTTSRLVSISLAGWNSYGKFLKEIANVEHYLKGQSVRCSESTTEEKTVVVEEAEVAVEQKEVSVERVKEYTPLIGQDTISITDSLLFDN